MKIRKLNEGDVDAFLELRRAALCDVPLAFTASPEDDLVSTPEVFRERIADAPETVIFGAFVERLVGVDPPWVTPTLFEHAVKLFNDNQASAAALELQYVVQADPEMARAHFLLGMSLFNSGRPDEGRVHLERFIELAPDDPDVEIARGLLSYQQ